MSFIPSAFAPRPLHSREEFMATFIQVARDLGMPDVRGAAVCAGMCAFQEAGAEDDEGVRQIWTPGNQADPCFAANPGAYPHDSEGDDGQSTGPFQQQMNRPGTTPWGWGGNYGDCDGTRKRMDMVESVRMFYSWPGSGLRFKNYDASNAQAANDSIQRVQGSGVPWAYAQWWDEANALYDQVAAGVPAPPQPGGNVVSGDPVWLEDVLRPALGDRLKTLPGWQDSGVGGTMREIWGMVWHHTGNGAATAQSIRDGRPDLAGPLSQLHIARDGIVTIVAVGPCNHAGAGSWVGLPTDDANDRTIGIECAWPMDTSITEATQTRERWPDAQIISMRDTAAALTQHLGVDVSHNISHSEWARFGPAGWRQGKWDPGNIDMNWFRGEIAKDIAGAFDPKPTVPPTPQPPAPPSDRALLEWIVAQLGDGDPAWASKGMTLRDKVWSLGKDAS